MAARISIPIIGGDSPDRSIAVSNERTIGMFLSQKNRNAKAPVVMHSFGGVVKKGTAGNGPCRTPHMVRWNQKLYGVFGDQLVSIDKFNVVTVIGTLNTGSGTVVVARGRDYIALVDGTNGYSYDGTTFSVITHAAFIDTATHIVYKDGYFIINDPATDRFYISSLEDPTTWNALDFAVAEVQPDKGLALAVTNDELVIFGDETTQPYFNTGDEDFPFTSNQVGVLDIGIAAPHSLARSAEGLFFVSLKPEGGISVTQVGDQFSGVISTDERNWRVSKLSNPFDAVGFTYSQDGRSYYVLNFIEDKITMIYSLADRQWSERKSGDTRWLISGHGYLNNKNIVGSYNSNKFYELSSSVFDEDGESLLRQHITAVIHHQERMMSFGRLVLSVQTGVGTLSGQGKNPQIKMRYSNDDGETWSTPEFMPLGKQADGRTRVIFSKLGRSYKRIFELTVTDPVDFTLIDGFVEVKV